MVGKFRCNVFYFPKLFPSFSRAKRRKAINIEKYDKTSSEVAFLAKIDTTFGDIMYYYIFSPLSRIVM